MFSNRLKDLRAGKNMTQDDLGKIFNVSGKTVGHSVGFFVYSLTTIRIVVRLYPKEGNKKTH